jgi:DNA-binding CsgD family transcriptional regulator
MVREDWAENGDVAPPRLSPNEREVLARILKGKSLKAIALDLKISAKTVSTYKSRIMTKLKVESNAELVVYGMLNFGIGGIYFKHDK